QGSARTGIEFGIYERKHHLNIIDHVDRIPAPAEADFQHDDIGRLLAEPPQCQCSCLLEGAVSMPDPARGGCDCIRAGDKSRLADDLVVEYEAFAETVQVGEIGRAHV